MTDNEWACKWVGWSTCRLDGEFLFTDSPVWEEYMGGGTISRSEADLAEAVRVKWQQTQFSRRPGTAMHAAGKWLEEGPAAFIAAVREIVDGQ